MVRARLLRKPAGDLPGAGVLFGYALAGHAGAEVEGKDIVCAAVSAIAQTTLFGLQDILGKDEVDVRMEDGDMRVSVPPKSAAKEGPKALLRALELGLKSIAECYPQSIRVDDSEH